MYNDYFGLKEAPFSIAPDPRYLYLSAAHREALAHLLYGVRGEGGFVLLTGDVGTGKTTICRCLLEQVPDTVQLALVLNPSLTIPELLATICDDFGVTYPQANLSNKVFIDALNRFLLDSHARGLTTVLIIDEAQNLAGEVLEQLRLLTNLETSSRKLLQIVLIGQPELREQLARPELRQVAQRITARYHLGPLGRGDLAGYLQHRLAVAGSRRQIFPPRAVSALYRASRGVPRLLNVLADRALLGAYAQGHATVSAATVRQSEREVLDPRPAAPGRLRWVLAALFAAAIVLLASGRMSVFAPPVPDATAARSEEVAPPASSLADWAEVLAATTGAWHQAESDLLHLWGVDPGASGNLRLNALSAGLDSLSTVGSLSLLGQLDRPAILHLRTADGAAAYGTLVRFKEEQLELLIDGRAVVLPADELERYWLGDFTLLWRPLFPQNQSLRRGDQGTAVAWLARSLPLSAEFSRAGAEGTLFDKALEARVKQFQLRNGLLPDGIAGPKTLILLNRTLGTPGPRLTGERRES